MQQVGRLVKSYRPDIDGLRAIAVLAVIGFHLDLEFLAGGYVGVDIFFVLSGFLITSTITQKMQNKAFSLTEFYRQRVNRLFPALYATVGLTFIAASFILLPNDFERFSLSSIASLLSISNVLFWGEAGYWDVASNTKPLLHTWSLGVEEQFYLIYPVLLLILSRAGLKPATPLLLLAAFGFLVCYFYTVIDTSGAFYLLPARFFQFLVGGALAVLVHERFLQSLLMKNYFTGLSLVVGLCLIVYSCVAFGQVVYPGAYALGPSLGTLLVIFSGSSSKAPGSIGSSILENPLFTWVGRISYSLYLTHWPIIVLYRYSTNERFTVLEVAGLLVATFLTGAILHYYVEKKFYASRFQIDGSRSLSVTGPKQTRVILALGLIMVGVSTHPYLNHGWAWRFDSLSYSAEEITAATFRRFAYFSGSCPVEKWPLGEKCAGDKPNTILFFGNSHEPDGISFIQTGYSESIKSHNLVTFGTVNDCQNLLYKEQSWRSDNEHCQNRLNHLFDPSFIASIDAIVYSYHHTFLAHNHTGWEIVKDLKAFNKDIKLIAIGDYIETKSPCVRLLNETGNTNSCFSTDNIAYSSKKYDTQKLYIDFSYLIDVYIDRLELLCDDTDDLSSCLSESPEGVPYSFDIHHVSLEFSEMSGRKYAAKYPDLFSDLLAYKALPARPAGEH